MIHITLPANFAPEAQELPFFLAMEEWVAASMRRGAEDAFFTWTVEPTVIFGRNQVAEKELDIDYCRSHGIRFFRRKSGGGCVMADRRNLMVSYITASPDDTPTIFSRYAATLAGSLRALGIDAEVSGRNDLTVGGAKVSGNAYYRTPSGVSIAHGTLLYDFDAEAMSRALTPSRSKMESKGVRSVASRVGMLKDHTSLSLAALRRGLETGLATGERRLTEADIAEIRAIERRYYLPDWTFGRRRSSSTSTRTARVEGVGEMEAAVSVGADGRIEAVDLTGDFFPVADLDAALLDHLRGAERSPEGLREALAGVDASAAIAGLDNETLVNLIL